ncbi:MAG: ferritin-like domain-containing protein [Acidobacteriota bacterium]|nr:ferritin-like domain-containing protein [Blastocatellia bacterium]MDW8238811.1 ferritin-like domain-containing protein [Acidobacteriota bacterium]
MKTQTYTLPVDQTEWIIPTVGIETVFNWDYDAGREKLLNLYEKGKTKQWNANERLDWSLEVNLDNPLGFPDEYVPIFGSDVWDKLNERERATVRRHLDSWRFSQFLHGEQGALICAAKIVQTVPDIDSKFYAATQVFDEARHVEVFSRYLREKIQLSYPINPHLKILLTQAITDSRWDMTYLAMQVIIEGLALAAFGTIRDLASEPLGQALTSFVMQDEARHVAFGRLALRDYYPQLTEAERDEREQFAVEACYLMRDRFLGQEVWEHLGLPVQECIEYVANSFFMKQYQRRLFTRIVPTLKDIGVWGPRIQRAFVDMDVLEFAEVDLDELSRMDEDVAAEYDRLRAARAAHVQETIAAAE